LEGSDVRAVGLNYKDHAVSSCRAYGTLSRTREWHH
jgi:hypothetical protein